MKGLKKVFRKVVSGVTAVALGISTFATVLTPMTASAATATMTSDDRGKSVKDSKGNVALLTEISSPMYTSMSAYMGLMPNMYFSYKSSPTASAVKYDFPVSAFCGDFKKSAKSGTKTEYSGMGFSTTTNVATAAEKQYMIGLLCFYGYPINKGKIAAEKDALGNPTFAGRYQSYYTATQLLVWEVIEGRRKFADFSLVGNDLIWGGDNVTKMYNRLSDTGKESYQEIVADMKARLSGKKGAGWDGDTWNLTFNFADNKWETTKQYTKEDFDIYKGLRYTSGFSSTTRTTNPSGSTYKYTLNVKRDATSTASKVTVSELNPQITSKGNMFNQTYVRWQDTSAAYQKHLSTYGADPLKNTINFTDSDGSLEVTKVVYDEYGKPTKLKGSELDDNKFVISTVQNGKTYYIKGEKSTTSAFTNSWKFTGVTTSKDDATRFYAGLSNSNSTASTVSLSVSHLPIGKYTIEETATTANYVLANTTALTATVVTDKTASVTAYNIKKTSPIGGTVIKNWQLNSLAEADASQWTTGSILTTAEMYALNEETVANGVDGIWGESFAAHVGFRAYLKVKTASDNGTFKAGQKLYLMNLVEKKDASNTYTFDSSEYTATGGGFQYGEAEHQHLTTAASKASVIKIDSYFQKAGGFKISKIPLTYFKADGFTRQDLGIFENKIYVEEFLIDDTTPQKALLKWCFPATELTVSNGGTGTIVNKERTFKFSLVKKNKKNEPVKGAIYELHYGDEILETKTTDANGKIAFTKALDPNRTYYVIEKQAPEGYVLDTTKYYIYRNTSWQTWASGNGSGSANLGTTSDMTTNSADLANDGVIEADIKKNVTEDEFGAYVEVTKRDPKGRVLSGVPFYIADSSGTPVCGGETNSSGKWTSIKLPLGTYTLYENEEAIKAKNLPLVLTGFSKKFTVKQTAEQRTSAVKSYTIKYDVENDYQEVDLTVNKLSADGGKATGLEGAKFEIKSTTPALVVCGVTIQPASTTIGTIETDSDGKASSKAAGLTMYAGHTYTVTEIQSPLGYKLVEGQSKTFKANPNYTKNLKYVSTKLDFTNTPTTVGVKILKLDNDTKERLANAGFYLKATNNITYADGTIWYAAGTTIATGYTDTNGELTFDKEVPTGFRYTITEFQPPEGYAKCPNDNFTITSTRNRDTSKDPIFVVRTLYDTENGVSVSVSKRDAITKMPLADTEFTLYAVDRIPKADGTTKYAADEAICSVTTGTDGTATFPIQVPYGYKYKVAETTPPDGYLNDSTPQTFTLTKEMAGASLAYTLPQAFENTPQPAKISVYKRAELKNIPLKDAEFGLYAGEKNVLSWDGKKTYKKDELIQKGKTNAGGNLVFDDVRSGYKYYIKEITPPEGYVLSNEVNTWNAESDPSVEYVAKDFVVINTPQYAFVNINNKQTEQGTPLEGVTFGLYAGEDIYNVDDTEILYTEDEQIDTLVTNQYGNGAFKMGVPVGYEYYVKEISTAKNYVLNDENWSLKPEYDAEKALNVENPNISLSVDDVVNKWQTAEITVYKKDGNAKEVFLANAEFDLRATNDIVVNGEPLYTAGETIEHGKTDAKGKIVFATKVPVGFDYSLVETKAPENYVSKNGETTFSVSAGDSKQEYIKVDETIYNDWQDGVITVHKKDSKDNTPIKGAGFTLYAAEDITLANGTILYAKDAEIDTKTTNAKGELSFKKVPVNFNYTIKETTVPEHYKPTNVEHTFLLKYRFDLAESAESVDIVNDWQYGSITVYKIDKDNNKKYLEGAKFVLMADEPVTQADGTTIIYEKDEEIQTLTTDSNGKLTFKNVPAGFKYVIKEVEAPAGYKLKEDTFKEIDLKSDVSVEYVEQEVSVENDSIDLYISKKALTDATPDTTDDNPELAGAVLELRNENNELVERWTSDGTSHVIKCVPAGKYTLKETKSPDGYVMADVIELEIAADGTTYVNDVLSKTVDDNPYITIFDDFTNIRISKQDITDKSEIEGAKLKVIDKQTEKVIDEWTSVKDTSHDIIGKLVVGKTYTLIEESAPQGYLIAEKIDFTVEGYTENGKAVVQTVVMEDDVTHVEISKTDITTGEEIEGAHLVVTNSKGEKIAEWETNGTPYKLYRLPVGTYTLTETAAPDGYLIAEAVEFEVTEGVDEQGKPVITKVDMQDDYTKLSIIKVDAETKKALKGAKLQLLNADGSVYDEWTTDGQAHSIERIPFGEYTLHEVSAPAGYVKFADKPISVKAEDFSKSNPVKKITVTDTFTVVEIDKTSITDGKKVIGAHLVIKDSAGEVFAEWDTTEEAHTIKRMPVGKYTLSETYAPDGYVIANTKEFEVLETNEIQKVEMSDDVTKLTIDKFKANVTDMNDKNLAGAVLRLIDKETNEVVDEWTTTKESYSIIEKLRAGHTYILREIKAPDGYVLANDVEITISLNGEQDYTSMTDDTTKVDISKKKITGDDELEGAYLQVIDTTTNKVVEEWVSGKKSHFIEAKLVAGREYILKETIAPKGFVISNDVHFTVSEDGSVDVVVMRDDTTKVEISKKSVVTGKELAGAVLSLYDGDELIETWTTTEDGTHFIEAKLEAGHTYRLVEVSAPKGYKITEEIEFTVSTDGSVDFVEMIDDYQTGHLEIQKKTEGQKNVAGIEFRLYGKSYLGIEVDLTTKTDKNGFAEFRDVPIGTYKLSENGKTVHPAYLIPDDEDVDIDVDTVTKKTWTNTEMLGNAEIHKITEQNKNVENIEFTLHGVSDTGRDISLSATTDADGIVVFRDIPVGTYTLTENGATVNTAYLVAKDKVVKVEYAKTTKTDVENEEKKGSVRVEKKTEGMVNLAGIEFIISGTSDTGREINGSAFTNEEGVAVFENLPIGTYTVTENAETVDKAFAYIIAEPQEVAVLYGEQTVTEFFNAEKEGTIHVVKRSEEQKNVSGIEFILEGTTDTGREFTATATTDENGDATFANIPIGTYTIRENGETVHYAYLVADKKTVEVFYAETTDVEIYNIEKTGEIQVQKKTEGMLNLEGIEFTLTGVSDSGREISMTAVTDADGIAKFGLVPIGTYTITEVETSVIAGYLVADPVEGKVFYAETNTVEVFNEERCGEIEIHKTTEGMLNLEGIKFILTGVSDAGREIKLEAITDKDGIAKFDKVPVGTYTITEDGETTPIAYLVADDTECSVVYAETTTVEIRNEEKSGTLHVKKRTEGDLNIEGIEFILFGISDSGREIRMTAVTDKDGNAVFENVPIGTYAITENEDTVPTAYLVSTVEGVEVIDAETTDLEVKNEEKCGSIKVQKKTANMTNIAGIKFILEGVSDSGREIRLEAVTDENGVATFDNVPVGTYSITEDGASVPTGYLVADGQSVTVLYAEETNVVFFNEEEEHPDNPKTGYDRDINFGLFGMAALTCAGMIFTARKRKDEE